MKPLVKMSKTEFIVFCLMASCSGLMIGIGGAAALLASSLFGNAGKLIGACLFSLGIFAIVTFEMRLFTGMVADIQNDVFGLKFKRIEIAIDESNAASIKLFERAGFSFVSREDELLNFAYERT